MRRGTYLRWRWALAATAVVASLAPVAPAAAHPFGPPATADVTVEGRDVTLRWRAAADDYAALGVAAGLLEVADAEPGAESAPAGTGLELDAAARRRLAGDPVLRTYLAERLAVHQDGRACEPDTLDTDGLFEDGLEARFRCPAPVAAVDIEIGLLTDLHAAYRTVARTDQPATPTTTVYTAAVSRLPWRFGATAAGATTSWPVLVLLALGTAGAVVLGGRLLPRRRPAEVTA